VSRQRNRLVIFGLDGGTFDVIGPLIEQGLVPTLARLMEQGAWGELESTIPPMTGPAWTSFMTGKSPGKHGVYGFRVREPETYDWPVATSRSISAPTLWDIAGSKDRRSIVIDVPMTFPPWRINGLMIATFLAPSRETIITMPPELHAEIVAHVGQYPFEDQIVPSYVRGKLGPIECLEHMFGNVRRKMETAIYLLTNHDWDLAAVVFRATDIVQHTAWRFWNEEYRRLNPEESAKYDSVIPQMYRAVDRAIEKILEKVGEDVSVVVMSDHGAGPFSHYFFCNRWLMKEGLLRLRRVGRLPRYQVRRTTKTLEDILRGRRLGRIGRLVPGSMRRMHPRLPRRRRDRLAHIDWGRTVAYAPLIGGCGGSIVLNVAGREREGIVTPGEEYERLRDSIIERLACLTNGSDGTPIVELVKRREELYAGPYVEGAPDIIYLLKGLRYVPRNDPTVGPVLQKPAYHHCATHRLNGMIIMAGPATGQNRRLQGAKIVDIAPTILYLMGLPVPGDMDGRILEGGIRDEYLRDHPPASEEPQDIPGTGAERRFSYSDQEEDKVEEMLRGLGYVG